MVQFDLKNPGKLAIATCVGLFALFALILRLMPMFTTPTTDIMNMVAMDDPFYNLRQVELMIPQFPGYAWFDPMTLYPTGSTIYWGPLFPALIALVCLIVGATTRPEIISVALLATPLLAAATVVVMYYVGKVFGDWKTGLLASGFTAIICGQFFTVSFYGYIDHHIAEVLFSTIFCLMYSYAIVSEKDKAIDIKKFSSYQKTVILGFLSGLAYLIGLLVMPTMILFAMIVALFTLIQFIIDFYRDRSSEYLLIINAVTFLVASVGLLAFGLKHAGIGLSVYSLGHIISYLGIIGGTCILYLLQGYLHKKEKYYYPVILAGAAILVTLILNIVFPQLYDLFINSLFAFFGQSSASDTVQEARGWSVEHAWQSFNYGLILFGGGILVLIYRNLREEHPHLVFALVWSLVMLFATWQHIRYEYYFAINIALLSGICLGFAGEPVWLYLKSKIPGIHPVTDNPAKTVDRESGDSPKKKAAKKQSKQDNGSGSANLPQTLLAAAVCVLAVLFVYTSVTYTYSMVSGSGYQLNSDWKESLEWMGTSTPDTGVDYYTIYAPDTFTYPNQSYGVMSWWDYGHMITYIAKRIPNANPFQQGVAGDNGAAAFFVATSEDTANTILDHDGTRYVVTDIMMDDVITGKFHAMATWYNSSAGLTPFAETFLVPGQQQSSQYSVAAFIQPAYFQTMVARLHTFDGSMTSPSEVLYIEYADPAVSGYSVPVVVSGETLNASEALEKTSQYNAGAKTGYHAGLFSSSLVAPTNTVPALRHYRLVHESPSNVFNSDAVDVKYVKVFEYVKGAHIRGTGIISVPVVTNTGRHFTYTQESLNGEFIVPYSTNGNPYSVKTEGLYRIEGNGETFEVPESAVMAGSSIN